MPEENWLLNTSSVAFNDYLYTEHRLKCNYYLIYSIINKTHSKLLFSAFVNQANRDFRELRGNLEINVNKTAKFSNEGN